MGPKDSLREGSEAGRREVVQVWGHAEERCDWACGRSDALLCARTGHSQTFSILFGEYAPPSVLPSLHK